MLPVCAQVGRPSNPSSKRHASGAAASPLASRSRGQRRPWGGRGRQDLGPRRQHDTTRPPEVDRHRGSFSLFRGPQAPTKVSHTRWISPVQPFRRRCVHPVPMGAPPRGSACMRRADLAQCLSNTFWGTAAQQARYCCVRTCLGGVLLLAAASKRLSGPLWSCLRDS